MMYFHWLLIINASCLSCKHGQPPLSLQEALLGHPVHGAAMGLCVRAQQGSLARLMLCAQAPETAPCSWFPAASWGCCSPG